MTLAYDAIEPRYDRMHARFLLWSGAVAQACLEGAVMAMATPGLRVLDAGCGTGQMARRLLATEPSARLVLLDQSPAMLAAARTVSARRVHGTLLCLPFADATFDLSLAAWSLEPLADPDRGISELLRVTRTGGVVGLVFCTTRGGSVVDRAIHGVIRWRGLGRPLCPDRTSAALLSAGPTSVRRLPVWGATAAVIARKGEPA